MVMKDLNKVLNKKNITNERRWPVCAVCGEPISKMETSYVDAEKKVIIKMWCHGDVEIVENTDMKMNGIDDCIPEKAFEKK